MTKEAEDAFGYIDELRRVLLAVSVQKGSYHFDVYVYEDQDIEEAAALMKERQIRRLVVLDRTKRLVGILSLGDIAEEADEVTSGEVLERVSEPSRHARASRRDS